jgi:hypothetical protein
MKKLIKIVLPIVLVIAILLPIFSCLGLTGKFYTLEEAYNNGYIIKEELQTIADMHNNGYVGLESLSNSRESEIKIALARHLRKNSDTFSDITAKEISVKAFYGAYDNVYVVKVAYGEYMDWIKPTEIEIDGIILHFSQPSRVKDLVVYKR